MKLSDVTWGGRVRREYKQQVLDIARAHCSRSESFVSGTMVSSSYTEVFDLLDGRISQTQVAELGTFGGVSVSGEKCWAFVLYHLGLDPRLVYKGKAPPTLPELLAELAASSSVGSTTPR